MINHRDPKREAQEAARRGDWRPTDSMLRKAEPDFVRRFYIAEAVRLEMRRLYARAVLVGHGKETREAAESRADSFWQEYAALDNKWLGDLSEIKAEIAKENV
jgi:hypothetical protein